MELYQYQLEVIKRMQPFYRMKERFQKEANLMRYALNNGNLTAASKYNAKMDAVSYCMDRTYN